MNNVNNTVAGKDNETVGTYEIVQVISWNTTIIHSSQYSDALKYELNIFFSKSLNVFFIYFFRYKQKSDSALQPATTRWRQLNLTTFRHQQFELVSVVAVERQCSWWR